MRIQYSFSLIVLLSISSIYSMEPGESLEGQPNFVLVGAPMSQYAPSAFAESAPPAYAPSAPLAQSSYGSSSYAAPSAYAPSAPLAKTYVNKSVQTDESTLKKKVRVFNVISSSKKSTTAQVSHESSSSNEISSMNPNNLLMGAINKKLAQIRNEAAQGDLNAAMALNNYQQLLKDGHVSDDDQGCKRLKDAGLVDVQESFQELRQIGPGMIERIGEPKTVIRLKPSIREAYNAEKKMEDEKVIQQGKWSFLRKGKK